MRPTLEQRTEQRMKHENALFIKAHEAAYGAPLGVLKNPPTKQDLDKAHRAFLDEKYGPSPKGRPTKKTAAAKPS